MTRRSNFIAAIVALLLSAAPAAPGAGVTVITHGLNGNADGWVTGMAGQIPDYPGFPGASFTFYKLYFYPSSGSYSMAWTRIGGSQPSATDSGEIIVALDWSQLSDGYSHDTYQVATAVSAALQSTNFISELNGHALCELPLHLIGHSRGGSLLSEVSLRLGTNGIWVDHLTTLDPHPLNNDGFSDFIYSAVDAPVRTYSNILFHDNYWQNLALLIYGEPVAGGYVRQLYDLSGGYNNATSVGADHANVHLWYHGTVDQRNPADDTEARLTSAEFSAWYVPYENSSYHAGFLWSRIGGGDRTTADQPVGPGYPAIRDGYNQHWDLGAGSNANRTALPSNNGSWPNLIKFDILGPHAVTNGDSVSCKYFFQYGQPASSSATVQIYLDADANPYNGNSGQVIQQVESGTGANTVRSRTVSFNTTNTPPGDYYLCARISAGTHTRYLLAPGTLTIAPGSNTTYLTVSITNPPHAETYTNRQTVTLAANASGNPRVASVGFYDGAVLKGTAPAQPYTYDWSFTAADNGAHAWTARAYDDAGTVSTSRVVTLTVSIDATPPTVAISSPVNGAKLTVPRIIVSGTANDPGSPSSGVAAVRVSLNGGAWTAATGTSRWTATVNLIPGTNTVRAYAVDAGGNFSSTNGVSVSYTPNPFLSVAGNYAGLFYDTNGGGVTVSNAGLVTATVTRSGKLSARLQHGALTYSLSGQLSATGGWGTNAIKGAPGMGAWLQVSLDGEDAITGQVSNSVWSARIEANRAVYSKTNPAPQAGHYTLIIPGSGDPANLPAGHGAAAINVSSVGAVTVSGTLGDGTTLTETTFVSRRGQWPLYAALYSKKGILIGWLTFTNDTATTSDLEGVVGWIKPGKTGIKVYPNGFDWPYDSDTNNAFGSAFTNRTPLLSWTNGVVILEDGNLVRSITNGLLIGKGGAVTGTNKLKLTITTSGTKAGLFKGSVVNPATGKSIPVTGALLQKQDAGFGSFLGTNQSGSVRLLEMR